MDPYRPMTDRGESGPTRTPPTSRGAAHHVVRRTVVIAVASVLCVAGLFATGSRASASTPSVVSIVSGGYAVHTDATTWTLSFFAVSGSTSDIAASLDRVVASGVEAHEWSVFSKGQTMTSTGAGHWKIDPPAGMVAPLFQVDLGFAATSHKAVACTKGSETIYTGTLSGKLVVATGFAGVGSVGSKSLSFRTPNTAMVDNGCVQREPPCPPAGLAFGAATVGPAGIVSVAGGATGSGTALSVLRTTLLKSPPHAARTDGAVTTGAKMSLSGSTLSVSPAHGAIIAGHATMRASGRPHSASSSCWLKGSKRSTIEVTWGTGNPPATFSSVPPLTAHLRLGGTIASGATGFGSFAKTTVG